MQELLDAFSRTGFTDGYFKGNLGKNMMSHDTPSNSAENKFTDEAKNVPQRTQISVKSTQVLWGH